ncbi:pilus assembly protein TadG-related protein [Phaeobacter sp. QD34_3]|uniref:TadE/TadG family type IV pilus assembly protein n=1 Tax=unclassified Phaeobacter TaxID=2621772 RepID=UPI00237F1E06|nr:MULTISPECIES: TadE/TadG family type IV pilus assembly protein [unclassified Phaeobacter]MDE4134631.1 pilus assembly protein TadG-related protein [Phaeobacter sp. QD34_3]MDE4138290.1 pilus assembly protein TadG-related protein [Phaeobacter sp. QD34_24]
MCARGKTEKGPKHSVLSAQAVRLRDFARDDSGAMAAPTIFFFLAMLAIGGIGIDLMRMERDRTILQYTLDRAVLAAADLDQPLSPALVVQDYLSKAGLDEYYQPPIVEQGLGYKKVESTINTTFDTHMLEFSGGANMPLHANARAEESIDGLEISLVLDVSGSMNSNSRLTNLKVAAKDFIDTMVANTTDGKMSVSIVPYATQVSIPDELAEQYNIDRPQTYANCVNFQSDHFDTTALSTTEALQGSMLFSPWSGSDYRSSGTLINQEVCSHDEDREVLLFEKNATTLKNFIQSLTAWGNTSIDVGMKWGTALLDPSARPAINALATGADAIVPSDFSARPAEYNDFETIKVIVLMTDGQNTSQYYMNEDYRSGATGVWYNPEQGVYSTYDPHNNRYYWHNRGIWMDHPYGASPGTEYCYQWYYGSCRRTATEGGTVAELNFGDLYAYTSVKSVYYMFSNAMGRSYARTYWYNYVYSSYGNSTKNARTRAICQAAKDQGIIVYTIGFEAPSDGVAVLQDCASSDAHYFDVDGLEISDAFASIATSIRQLRLTQ